jgi:hypothetical protein
MSSQIQNLSRLSKILREHLLLLVNETCVKIKVVLLFSNGFDVERYSINCNCLEIEDTWFGLKSHMNTPQIRERYESHWYDKKCQLDFLVNQLRSLSVKFFVGVDAETVKSLRACLQLLKSVIEEVRIC